MTDSYEDLEIQAWRIPAHGGQRVVATESGVAVVHRPTGIGVIVRSEKSQLRNRELAIEKLTVLLRGDGDSAPAIEAMPEPTMSRNEQSTADLRAPEMARLRWQLTIAEDALRAIADPGCMVVHDDERESWIDTGIPGRIADGALKRIQDAVRDGGWERITHGRHCTCSACAREDWTNLDLAPCGMHERDCPPRYQPLGLAGDYASKAHRSHDRESARLGRWQA